MSDAVALAQPARVSLAIRDAAVALTPLSDTPRLDAELLMAHALGVTRSELLLRHMAEPAPDAFASLIARRMRAEPVAYILGVQEFFGHPLRVTPDVLIPRADSETLVERAVAARPDARRVLDCGTGSGALLIAVLALLPQATGIGIDRSDAAVRVASANARRIGVGERCDMRVADWDRAGWSDTLGGPFDLILANPPYVEDDAALTSSVRDHEPAGALFAGADGLDAYRALIPQLPALLVPRGAALIEIGATQADAVTALGEAAGFVASLHRDLAGRPRTLEFRAPT